MNTRSAWIVGIGAAALFACSLNTLACPPGSTDSSAPKTDNPPLVDDGMPEWMAKFKPDPDSPAAKKYAAHQKTRRETEKELKQLRAKYFRQTKNVETRQVGFGKLRGYTDPALFPTLIELFGSEDADVRDALLDHFADLKTDEADASLTWSAVFGKDKPMREAAAKRVAARVQEAGKASYRIQSVIATGLKESSNDRAAAAAKLAQTLKLYDAIPMMINAQILGTAGPTQADDGGDAALAYILIGQQQTFVSDLTPVVGDSAVGFDPTLSVLTEGTIVRVIDAYVVTYRTEVNAALIGLTTQGWGGQSTAHLGWDNKAWRAWYAQEFLPYRKQVEQKAAQAAANKPL